MALDGLTVVLSLDDDGFQAGIVSAGSALQQLNLNINQVIGSSTGLDSAVSHLGSSFAGWTVAIEAASMAFHELLSVTTEYGQKLIEVNDSIQKTTILLAGLSQASSQAGRQMDAQNDMKGLLDMASDSPYKLDTLTDTFIKMKTAGIDPMNGSMKALTNAIAAFGGDDSRLQRAGYAIQEMAGRGVISLQNLRRQLGQDIPGAVQIMADSMDMTVEQLDKKVQSGTLNATHALTLMLDGFDETFGGASAQLMSTFSGRVSQVENSLQRLALVAGGQVKPSLDNLFGDMSEGGQKNANGAYAEALKQIGQINDLLKSPEMVASAITLNNTLKEAAQSAGDFIRTVIEWRGPIADAVEILGELVAGFVAWKAVMFAISLPRTIYASLVGISEIIATLPGKWNMLQTVMGLSLNLLQALGTSIVSRFVPGIVLATTGVEGLAVALAGLVAGFSMLAIPVAVGVGLYELFGYIQKIQAQSEIAATALGRLLQGDITSGNVSGAKQDVEDLNDRVDALKEKIKELDDQEHRGALGKSIVGAFNQNIGVGSTAVGNIPAVPDLTDTSSMAALEDQKTKLRAQMEAIQKEIQDGTVAIQNSASQQLEMSAKTQVGQLINSLNAEFQSIAVMFHDHANDIKDAREAVSNTPGNHDEQLTMLDQAALQNVIDQGNQKIAATERQLSIIQSLYDDASRKRNDTDKRMYAMELDQFTTYANQIKEQVQREIADKKGADVSGDGSPADQTVKSTKIAETSIQDLTAKTAQLTAAMEGTGSAAAKVATLLANPKFAGLDPKVRTDWEAAATAMDRATAAKKAFDEAMRAEKNIDLGLDKANEQLQMYAANLADGGKLTAGQRATADFQRQLNEQVNNLNRALLNVKGPMSDIIGNFFAWANGASAAANAMNTMNIANILRDADTMRNQAHQNELNSMSAAKRAQEELNDRRAQSASIIARTNEALKTATGEQRAQLQLALQTEQASAAAFERGATNRIDTAGVKANRPGDDAVKSLADKVAELKAQVSGADPELAKINEQIAQSAGFSKSAGDAARALAAEITKLKPAAEAARQALSSMTSLKSNGEELQDTNKLLAAEMDGLKGRTRVLAIEQQILETKVKQEQAVAKVAAAEKGAATQGPQVLAQAQANTKAAQAQADNNVNLTEANKLMQDLLQKQNEVAASAKDNAGYRERVALVTSEYSQEVDKLNLLTERHALSDAQQKQGLDILYTWQKGQLDELAKKDADVLQKMAADWGNFDKQAETIGKSVMEDFNKNLVDMLTKGKVNWRDFGNTVVQEIETMSLKLMESAIIKMIDPMGGGAGGAGSLLGAIGGLLGLGGGGGDAFSGAGTTGEGWHTGGVLGSDSSTFTRTVSSGALSGAMRYHTGGIAGDEVPSILQKGEGVFTAGQMGAIGDLNAGYRAMAQAIAGMASAVAKPPGNAISSVTPGTQVNPNSGYGGNQQLQPVFNLTNTSGTPMQAVQTGSRQQNQQAIVDIVLKAVQNPGPLRTAIRTN